MTKLASDDHQTLRAGFRMRGVPDDVIDGLIKYHTPVSYAAGGLVFRQDSAADIIFWVIKGMVKVYYPQPDGSRILVRLAGPGDVIGGVDAIDDRGQCIRRFEAQAMTKCVLAMATRQQILRLLERVDRATMLEMLQQLNALWASWLVYYVNFLGLSCRERIELVFGELAERFGVKDKDGILLTFAPLHSDLAEMIGSSRPMVSRLIAVMVEEGVIARRGKQYVLLKGGGLAARVVKVSERTLARLPMSNGSRNNKASVPQVA